MAELEKSYGETRKGSATMNVLDRVCLDKVDVRHMTEEELARLGVRLIDHNQLILQCLHCEETWEPMLDSSGKLPAGYWKCPAECSEA